MKITLYTSEIIKAVRETSRLELSSIQDPDARYRVEAGTEKTKELYRCIWEAYARLSARCSRWLSAHYESSRDNVTDIPDSFVFDFVLSERRAINHDSIVEPMHTFMVEYAMSKFYSLVSQGELSNKHSMLAIDAGNQIDQLLYTKQPPRV